MVTVILLLCVAMGAGLQVQAGVNSRLAHFLGSPLRAATVSFLVGFVALAIVTAIIIQAKYEAI